MGFKEDLLKLATQAETWKEHITNEEMTKHSLIIPFLQVMGYDIFNPLEVRPEYYSAFGGAKNAKVDYAIYKNESPIMFFEAKPVNDSLKGHFSQLMAYFNATPTVKVAVITNGMIYRFYTDLDAPNIMDSNPFLEINITSLSDSDIEALSMFRKEEFDVQKVVSVAEDLTYAANLNRILEDVFRDPPDDFVKYLLGELKYSGPKTASVVEKFRPLIKKAISQALINLVQKGLDAPSFFEEVAATEEVGLKKTITTTEYEMRAFALVKDILEEAGQDFQSLHYKDTTSYFGIFLKNPSNWIIRINLDSSKKHITTNLSIERLQELAVGYEVGEGNKGIGVSRVFIESVDDVLKLKQVIIEAYNLINQQ
jgi:hypothetical protein